MFPATELFLGTMWNSGCFVRNPKTKNACVELEIMNYFCVFDFDAGAGSSEESGSVSGCRTQPDEDGKKGTAEKS